MRFSRLALLGLLTGSAQAQLKMLQTGPSTGSTYASSFMTDGTGLVYFVGSTYDPELDSPIQATAALPESKCFVFSWRMGDDDWEEQILLGNDNALESCHGVGLINAEALALIGNSEPGGLFANANNKMSGFTALIDKESLQLTGGTTIQMSNGVKIPYPISVVSDTNNGVYVIALTTTDDEFSDKYNIATASQFPNWIQYEKYGSAFDMTVMRFNFDQPENSFGLPEGQPTLTSVWHREFPFDVDPTGRVPRAYLSGLILKNNSFLIVAGSTFGKGNGYGGATGEDLDGFMTLLDLETGDLLTNGQKNQQRIGSGEDDLITGICDNPDDPNSFYVVGMTKGDLDGIQSDQLDIKPGSRQAFIKKMNLEVLHGFWTIQWGAINGDMITSAYALSCVAEDGTVYVAGQVEDGAGIVQGFTAQESKGGNDIFLAKINDLGTDYDVDWVQQIGTDGDDTLARYGGVILDWSGNPIVYGDTTGSIARNRGANEANTDVFFMTLDKNFQPPGSGGSGPNPSPVSSPVAAPTGGGVGVTTPSGVEGVQSGPGAGSTYASGLVYDGNDEIFLVGNTYDSSLEGDSAGQAFANSNCFVTSIDIDDWNRENYAFNSGKVFGDASVLESCHGLGLVNPHTLMMIGNSEPGGLYANGQTTMSAFAATMDKNFLHLDTGMTFQMSQNDKIPYPISVASDGDSTAYIMALTSTDASLSQRFAQASAADYPNWVEFEKYGSSFDMTVMKVEITSNVDSLGFDESPTIQTAWRKEFPINPESNGNIPRAYLGGLILKQEEDRKLLIVAGSTRGLGEGYGNAEGDDEDGFLTILDLETGELAYGIPAHQKRVGSSEDDLITGICDNPNDTGSFFVVGATKGDVGGVQPGQADIVDGSVQAFIMKVRASSLRPIWTVQWGAKNGNLETSAIAVDCVVAGGSVYVAGNVENGAGMVLGTEVLDSNGGDDIWVARLSDLGDTFVTAWFQQLGTAGDDHIARYGGITADKNRNAIVYGDTTGPMFRNRQVDPQKSDIFVMRLDRGEFTAPVQSPVQGQPPVQAPVAAPIRPPTEPPHEHVAIGVQYTGPVYAGGVVYDSSLDRCLFTGASYNPLGVSSSNCYVAAISMNTGVLLSREEYGNGSTNEACSAIAFSPSDDLAYVAGGTERNGLFTGTTTLDPLAVQYGLILQVSDRAELKGYGFNDGAKAQYPVAIVSDPSGDAVYVASMASDSSDQSWFGADAHPNWTSGGNRKYGSDFYLVVERYQTGPPPAGEAAGRTVIQEWFKEFKYDTNDPSRGGVIVSSMVLGAGGTQLVVTGSTRQSGGPFGTNVGTDMDGWILKLDPETGELASTAGARNSIRVDDASQADDWIAAVCTDRFDQDSIYIVGSSDEAIEGFPVGSTHAFIAKISLSALTRQWRVHLPMVSTSGSPPEASALGCAVAPDSDGGKVYVVGTILDGAVMKDAKENTSHGEDDIFIVQFDASNGDIEWTRQVGSEENDHVATGNPITLDADGNAVVFGNTYGSLYYYRAAGSAVSDTFLMTFSKIDGSYKAILSQGGVPHPKPEDLTGETPLDSPEESYDESFVPDNIVALQTGPDVGPTYAGGMVYDRVSNAVYLTGATYGSFAGPGIEALPASSCFFGVAILPKLQWRERDTYGTRNVAEACNSLSLTKYGNSDAAIIVGSTEEDGLLTKLGGGNPAKQYGFAMDLSNKGGKFELLGGALMEGSVVQYPISVVADNNKVWVVSMASKDTKVTADFQKVADNKYPNLTTGGIEKYGAEYTIVVEKHTMIRSPESGGGVVEERTLALDWRKPFETADMESVFVSGMIKTNRGDELVIVGSTRGSPGGQTMDGIMAKVSSDDGSFVFEGGSSRSVAYFSSVTGRDDWIMNMCADPDDDNHFYVVGATKGRHDFAVSKTDEDLTVHAVFAKINLDSLTSVWTKQYTVKHASGNTDKEAAAAALGCDVIAGEKLMYIAGVVENFATIQHDGGEEQTSAGGDDIFVSLVSTTDGTTRWLKQVGSNGDDRLARGGGISADANKNAVVFGDTNGSFYRTRTEDSNPLSSDIFVMLFDFVDGKHLPPLKAPPIASTTTAPPKEWFPDFTMNFKDPKLLAFAITALVVLAVALICCVVCRRRQRKKLDAQKTSIFTYLQQFDVEDIDLRKSPPGGWHGTYLNKLAYGINNSDASHAQDTGDGSYETAPLTHSSVVSDSLFMDTSSAPTLGYTDEPTYDDLKPKTYEDDNGNLKARDII